MEFNSNQPIYMQIIRLVENRLINQEWQAGQKVPSVREFALELRVNPNTIQRAYMELERQGLIFSKRGMGNFVTEDTQKITSLFNTIAQEKVNNFIQEMAEIGFSKEEVVELIKNKQEAGEK